MYIAYVDDSGNTGIPGSRTYTLGCVLVGAGAWYDSLNALIDFRRSLKHDFGVPMTAELKANFLIRNKGAFFRLGLSEPERREIYRRAMAVQFGAQLRTFAVVIDKEKLAIRRPSVNPREVAREFLFQRLERTSDRLNRPAMIIHDEGDSATIRALARKARRAGSAGSAFGTGSIRRPATKLLDDPVPRNSRQSYFIQLADLNAYAAFRRIFPAANRSVQIVPQSTWDELGRAQFRLASYFRGRFPAIVLYPD